MRGDEGTVRMSVGCLAGEVFEEGEGKRAPGDDGDAVEDEAAGGCEIRVRETAGHR